MHRPDTSHVLLHTLRLGLHCRVQYGVRQPSWTFSIHMLASKVSRGKSNLNNNTNTSFPVSGPTTPGKNQSEAMEQTQQMMQVSYQDRQLGICKAMCIVKNQKANRDVSSQPEKRGEFISFFLFVFSFLILIPNVYHYHVWM